MGPYWHCHKGMPISHTSSEYMDQADNHSRNRKFLRKYIPLYQPASRRSILEDIVHLYPALSIHDNTTPPYTYIPHLHIPKKKTIPPSTTRADMEVNSPKVTLTSGLALPSPDPILVETPILPPSTSTPQPPRSLTRIKNPPCGKIW